MEGREVEGDQQWYKHLYYGTSNYRKGVAIAVAERSRDKISLIKRLSDRLMAVKICAGSKIMRMVAAYTSYDKNGVNGKVQIWMDLDDYICTVSKDESLLLGVDLNGHVGIIL